MNGTLKIRLRLVSSKTFPPIGLFIPFEHMNCSMADQPHHQNYYQSKEDNNLQLKHIDNKEQV